MARRVFFSFHYGDDVNRACVVRNSWVVQGVKEANYIDKAEFEKIKQQGDQAVHKWIDGQLLGTSVTVVLLGSVTLSRPFVQYEIWQSLIKGNAIIGVHINNIKDMRTQATSIKGDPHTIIRYSIGGRPLYFDNVCNRIYDWTYDNGYNNLGSWIEAAAKAKGK